MLKITRRRVLAFAAALVPVLGFRRAVAGPELVVEPVPLPVPVPEPVASQSPVIIGWWRGPGGWSYHPDLAWMHSFMPMRDLTPPNWYGPPPPLPARIAMDWGKILNG